MHELWQIGKNCRDWRPVLRCRRYLTGEQVPKAGSERIDVSAPDLRTGWCLTGEYLGCHEARCSAARSASERTTELLKIDQFGFALGGQQDIAWRNVSMGMAQCMHSRQALSDGSQRRHAFAEAHWGPLRQQGVKTAARTILHQHSSTKLGVQQSVNFNRILVLHLHPVLEQCAYRLGLTGGLERKIYLVFDPPK
ncbi:hypothetical protein GCM10027417_05270 [Glutamicibacter endophyticus]